MLTENLNMRSRLLIAILSLFIFSMPASSQKQVTIDRTRLAQDRSRKAAAKKQAERKKRQAEAEALAETKTQSVKRPVSKPVSPKVASYLRVNSNYSDNISTNVAHFSNTRIFSIDTDGKSWTISHLPVWCSILSRTTSTVSIYFGDNYSCDSRKDWFMVQSDNKYVRVNVNQEGKPYNVVASVGEVSIDHNILDSGSECMKVTGSFRIKNGEGLTFYAVAVMQDEYGNYVRADYNHPTYKMKDGTFYATNKTTTFYGDPQNHHFVIRIPNNAFFPGYKKKQKRKLAIVLYCDNKGEYVQGVSRTIPIVVTRKKGITRTKN